MTPNEDSVFGGDPAPNPVNKHTLFGDIGIIPFVVTGEGSYLTVLVGGRPSILHDVDTTPPAPPPIIPR